MITLKPNKPRFAKNAIAVGVNQWSELETGALETVSSGWQRPDDWLDMPELVVGDEKAVFLVAVTDTDNNPFWFSNIAAVDIDLGDGNGVTTNVDCAGSRGFNLVYADYAGSETSEGFRQALITITPNGSGVLGNISLVSTPAKGYTDKGHDPNIAVLDYIAAVPNCTNFDLSGTAILSSLRNFKFVGSVQFTSLINLANALYSLQNITLPDGLISTAMNAAFSGTSSLNTPPVIDTSTASSFNSCFFDSGIKEAPDWNFQSATNIDKLFYNVKSIAYVPTYDFDNVLEAGSAFRNMQSLIHVEPQSLPLCTEIDFIANTNGALRSLELTDLGNVTNTASAFAGCDSLSSLILEGLTVGVDIQYSNMSATALNIFFTSLGTANGAQTINVATNPGALTCDTSIATTKGWTVITA
ncbi:MAG: hypothetical protein GY941_19890 [Planctomycetes bacterium]|nr:hypothetical protein [Planctomycetota bacterium]